MGLNPKYEARSHTYASLAAGQLDPFNAGNATQYERHFTKPCHDNANGTQRRISNQKCLTPKVVVTSITTLSVDMRGNESETTIRNSMLTISSTTGTVNGDGHSPRQKNLFLLYGAPVVIILGTVGNGLCLVVMADRSYRGKSYSVYISSLAVIDLCCLWIMYASLWLIRNFTPQWSHPWLCKTMTVNDNTLNDLSVWVMVAMTVDRFVAVRFPLKASRMVTSSRAKVVVTVTAIISFLKNCHSFVTTSLVRDQKTGAIICNYVYHDSLFTQVLPWLDVCTQSAIPFLVLLTLNFIIINTIKNQMVNEFQAEEQKARMGKRERQITVSLIVVSCTFLALTLPLRIINIVAVFVHINMQQYFILLHVGYLLLYTNNAVNFYLYCLTGAKFRHEVVKRLYGCAMGTAADSAYISSTSNTQCESNVALSISTSQNEFGSREPIGNDQEIMNVKDQQPK